MQINLDLIYDKINKSIKDSVESLQGSSHELIFDQGRRIVAEFLKDNVGAEEWFTLMRFNSFGNFDDFSFADQLICHRGKGKGLYLAGVNCDSSKENGFFLILKKISSTEFECLITEKISLTSNVSNLVLYDDDHRVNLEDLSYRELIDLLVRIRGCTLETLFESTFPILWYSDTKKFNKICDSSGKIRDEYKDEDLYGLIEETISKDEFKHCMFTRTMFVVSDIPLMNRGWSKSYKFTIDFSDAVVLLDESQKRLIPVIESRIREVLIENTPKSIETRVINNLDLSEIAENVAINDASCETGIISEIEDRDGDIEKIALAIIEEKNFGDIIFESSYGAEQWIYLQKLFNSDNQSSRYSFNLRYTSRVFGPRDYIIHEDGHLMWMNNVIEDIMIKDQLSEDSYDSIRDEIFYRYEERYVCSRDEIEFEIDFSDLFEETPKL